MPAKQRTAANILWGVRVNLCFIGQTPVGFISIIYAGTGGIMWREAVGVGEASLQRTGRSL